MPRRLSIFIFCLLPTLCFASQQASNSWEVVLKNIANSLTGPVTYFIAIMAIFSCGMVIVFTDMQNGGKRFVMAGCGIAMAAGGPAIVTHFLGVNGALI